MKNWTRIGLAVATASLLIACGGAKPGGTGSGTGGEPGTRGTGGTTAEGKKGSGLTDEDFTVRKIEEVEAPTYFEDVNKEAQDRLREGVKLVLQSPPDYKAGAAKFKEAIDLDNAFLEAYFNLGQCYERMGQSEDALKVYQSALDKNPANPSANAYIAKIYLGKARQAGLSGDAPTQAKWLTKAKGLLDGVIGSAPNDVAVNNAMSLYYLMQDDLDAAERYVKEVLYVEPTDVTALNTRGLINLKRGKYLIAKWIFSEKVLKADPNSVEALTNLGLTYIKLNVRPLAMKYFKEALALDPSNMDVRMNIAAMMLEHLDYAQAHEHYTKVLEAEPLNTEAHEGLCDANFGLGGSAEDSKAQYEKAMKCYHDFVEKRAPNRTDLYKRIAETYQVKLQDLPNSIKYFELYLAKTPSLTAEDKDKVLKTVKVLKDIEAKGGLKAMMAPQPEGGEGGEGGEMEPMEPMEPMEEGSGEEGKKPEDQASAEGNN